MFTDPDDRLPFIDEHSLLIKAAAPAVWDALIATVAAPHSTKADFYLRMISPDPAYRTGTFPEPGSALPGFAVAETDPEHILRLTGRHRFSRYELTAILDRHADGILLTVRSRGLFPGLTGSIYRGLVIGSGAHRRIVPRMLRGIRRRAESADSR